MSKLKTKALYVCQQCGAQSVKWLGRCPSCGEWNTLVEEMVETAPRREFSLEAAAPTLLEQVSLDDTQRLRTGWGEFDRVLGGGIVPGSVVLVGGEPGIGKSTLLLSIAGALASVGKNVLYVSGEESLRQTKLRAARLGLAQAKIQLLAQTQLEIVVEAIKRVSADVVIADSIQVMETQFLGSAPGSIGQVRACAQELVRLAKETHTALFLVGHVTKEGYLAGPKVLEHLVDTVLHFEGEPSSGFRILRSSKNRFGATHELGVFHMTSEGLVQVENPSEFFLSDRKEAAPGCMVTVSLEASRPLLVEVQALTSPCGIGFPRRRTAGLDFNRLSMLLAVLERRAGFHQLAQQDVFVSSLGGVRLLEPAADLAVAIAIASSVRERPSRLRDAAIGEVGLTGEVRTVANIGQRLHEAKRLGFERCFLAAGRGLLEMDGMEVIPVHHVREAVARALE
ncbi:MAG: DNA repair protein RadA [Candidatus Omnitrophica bacterium]|nr:DNA repair protein RadA [Candidatus Omnitrophota bacterium]MBI2173762.1 DNA repair protein RadA [Candidatus Omnitrophota bacterium]MBI3010244.1 DNA repair protein RadA [Candidatus Omnitrophota bacterium]